MKKIRIILIKFLTDRLLKAVTIDDLLRDVGGKLYLGKKKLSQEEIAALREDAESFKNSLLWKMITNNIYWIANFKMLKAANYEETLAGRMMILNIETIELFIEKLRR